MNYYKYKVARRCAGDIDGFEDLVTEFLNTGWKLHGNMVVDGGYYYQTLIKKGIDL